VTSGFAQVDVVAIAKYGLIKRGGSIILTAGTAAFAPNRNFSIRGALNGAVISLTKGLAVDLAENGIRVNTVIPGPVETELWDSAGASKELLLEGRKRLLVPFVGQPSDVAESYIYFLRADYSTGVTVVIDGGELLVRK
jgi:NAD(P)-dependent dehydrogenase (short-subunit alcohol dehydrogenase family)